MGVLNARGCLRDAVGGKELMGRLKIHGAQQQAASRPVSRGPLGLGRSNIHISN